MCIYVGDLICCSWAHNLPQIVEKFVAVRHLRIHWDDSRNTRIGCGVDVVHRHLGRRQEWRRSHVANLKKSQRCSSSSTLTPHAVNSAVDRSEEPPPIDPPILLESPRRAANTSPTRLQFATHTASTSPINRHTRSASKKRWIRLAKLQPTSAVPAHQKYVGFTHWIDRA